LRHIVIRGFERKAILKDDTDREDFIERLSNLLQEMDADAIGRATQRVSQVPELLSDTKTVQRGLGNNQS
jgi:hypothetical protein